MMWKKKRRNRCKINTNTTEQVSSYQKYTEAGLVGITKDGEDYIPCEYRKNYIIRFCTLQLFKRRNGKRIRYLRNRR